MYYFGKSEENMDLTRIYLTVQDSSPNMFQFTFRKGADRKCLIVIVCICYKNPKFTQKSLTLTDLLRLT